MGAVRSILRGASVCVCVGVRRLAFSCTLVVEHWLEPVVAENAGPADDRERKQQQRAADADAEQRAHKNPSRGGCFLQRLHW